MADLDLVRSIAAQDSFVVVATTRADGTVQTSVVNAGVISDPNGAGDVVAFVGRAQSAKLRNLRDRPRAVVVFRAGGMWASVEGPIAVIGPDEPPCDIDDERRRVMFREVFTAAGGTHDDWDEYDRAMADERRLIVTVTPERVTSN